MLGAVAACLAAPAGAEITPTEVRFDNGAVAQSLTGVPGDPAAGAKLLSSRADANCVACHMIAAQPDVAFQGDVGPALDDVASRYSEAQLRGIVANSKLTFAGSVMPSFYKVGGHVRPGDGFTGNPAPADLGPILSAQQVEDLVAYLLTLKP